MFRGVKMSHAIVCMVLLLSSFCTCFGQESARLLTLEERRKVKLKVEIPPNSYGPLGKEGNLCERCLPTPLSTPAWKKTFLWVVKGVKSLDKALFGDGS